MVDNNDDLTLYLLRHGESIANVDRVFAARKVDPPLSDMGREQIQRQSKALASVRFDACYTSPLLRARQSAEILSEGIGPQFAETNALLEVHVGALDGESEDSSRNRAVYEDVVRNWARGLSTAAFPGGESLHDIEARFATLLADLEGQKTVLLLGHCLLFMCLLWLLDDDRGPTLESRHMGRGHLSILVKAAGRFRLQDFNRAPPDS